MPAPSQQILERIAQDVPRQRHHEMVYPRSDGVGNAGGPIELNGDAEDESNGPAATKDYWGEPRVIMPLSTITSLWYFIGAYITLNNAGSADKYFQGAFYRVCTYHDASRDAGNAWDEGATVLTVDDAGPFVTNDLVWIVSNGHTDGEIQKVTDVTGAVVTVVRETSQFAGPNNTGLRWNHTTDGAGSEKMYLCERMTSAEWHPLFFQFENNTTRHTVRYAWNAYKMMHANDGLIARVLNETDSANDKSVVVKAIYNHP